MRSYRLKGLLAVGVLFIVFSFSIFLVYSLIKINLDGLGGLLELIFEQAILVKDIKSPLPQALLGGWETHAAIPLQGQRILTDIITSVIPEAKAYPLHIARINIYKEGATSTPLGQALGFFLPPAVAQSYFYFEPAFQENQTGPYCYLWPNAIDFQATAGKRLWIADEFAGDNLNLTPCKIKGFFYPRLSGLFLKLPILFLDELTLSRACFKNLFEFEAALPLTNPAYLEGKLQATTIVKISEHKPRSLDYIFSLPLTPKDLSDINYVSNYLYLKTSPSAIPQAILKLNETFRQKSLDLEAVSLMHALNWQILSPQLRLAISVFIVLFVILILLANIILRPVFRSKGSCYPTPRDARGYKLSITFLLIFLAFGCGILGSSCGIAFMVWGGPALKDFFSWVLGFPLAKIWPHPEAFLLVALASLFFALGSLGGPLKRCRDLLRKTNSQEEASGAEA